MNTNKRVINHQLGTCTITIAKSTTAGWTVVADIAVGKESKIVETLTQSGHRTEEEAAACSTWMEAYYCGRITLLARAS